MLFRSEYDQSFANINDHYLEFTYVTTALSFILI